MTHLWLIIENPKKLFGGWSGIIITLSLFLIVTSAAEAGFLTHLIGWSINIENLNENHSKPIRRSFFEVFWLTHHLFIVFFAFLIIHGFGRQIRGQTNLDEHDPYFCHNRTEEWGQEQVSNIWARPKVDGLESNRSKMVVEVIGAKGDGHSTETERSQWILISGPSTFT